MKKYVIPLILSLFVFVMGMMLLNQYKIKPTEIIVELDALVPINDNFELLYLEDGMGYFSHDRSTRIKVVGSSDFQKIRFNFPIEKSITRLRVDIGHNKEQGNIIIKDVKLKWKRRTYTFSIKNDFIPTSYIKWESDTIITQIINDMYSPYFISNFDVKTTIENLSKEQSLLRKDSIALLSIFATSLFFIFYYREIELKKIYSYLFIIAFSIILVVPIFVNIFNLDVSSELTVAEKRVLNAKPEFNMTKGYTQLFEQYYNDNFGLRTLFVNWNSKIKLDYFRVSPKPEKVLFGNKGFMFFNNKQDAIYDSYSNKNLIDKQKLALSYKKQVNLKKELAEKNIKYIVGFFPNKHTIYKDEMPFSMKMQITRDTSLADQFVAYFRSKKYPLVDVREALLIAKKEKQLYHKFDTHWNSYGAYIGYKSFCNQTFDILKLTPYEISNFNIKYSQTRSGDLTNMIGISEIKSYSDESPIFNLKNIKIEYDTLNADSFSKKTVITINENCDNQTTVLVFGDSFTKALIQFFSLHFHKVIYIRSSAIDMNLIEKTKPDIVMSLCVERYLTNFLK